MGAERNIGRIVSVDSLNIFVRLDDDLKSLYRNGYEEIYPVARINSYIVLPVGADRIVAMVNRVMTREETNIPQAGNVIFLTDSSRFLSATMIGTIADDRYIQGVYNYPILDNPVWYVTREDLNIIFDQKEKKTIDFKEDFYLPIGTSPAFPDFQVKINPDKMFAKHVAILGNTGSGKSCTVASILQSLFRFDYNGQELKGSHIVILDTNGEYKNAFKLKNKDVLNPLCVNEDGLKIPYWFMNYDDLDYLFEPTSGTQSPILKRALALAKSTKVAEEQKVIPVMYMNLLKAIIASFDIPYSVNNLKTIYCHVEILKERFETIKENVTFDLSEMINALDLLLNQKKSLSKKGDFINGVYDMDVAQQALDILTKNLEKYKTEQGNKTSSENRNIDLPIFYDFKELLSNYFDYAINESDVSRDKIAEYVSTLKLRMQSFVDDIRLSSPLLMDTHEDFQDALLQLLAFLLGDYCKVYNKSEYKDSVYHTYFQQQYPQGEGKTESRNRITVIDMSLLPFQVLETVTGLIGRIILEFLSRFSKDDRGKTPVLIVLEEAQNYIPEVNRKDRESISKKVFERIAREGRKYGLSLLVSSQRPSELSKTVLSQCNSFIVHRIQNPDDQTYIRKLVTSANSEILSQLSTLPQQHAIVMGDCVRTPVVVKMNTAAPKPNSENPEFISNWLKGEGVNYSKVVKEWLKD
jgi:hypothetical protein